MDAARCSQTNTDDEIVTQTNVGGRQHLPETPVETRRRVR
jgi:hypothetical protein